MEITKSQTAGIIIGVILIGASFVFFGTQFFFLIMGIGIISASIPFVLAIMRSSRIDAEKEDMFLEFSRDLVESVKSGTPINKSIVNSRSKPYGALSINIQKLANQISLGIPLKYALQTFSEDVKNKSISRALTLIGQAEKAGGDIGKILESVASAVTLSDKLNKERESSASTLVIQGYVIFFIFLVIILVMEFKILPLLSSFSNLGASGLGSLLGTSIGSGGGTKINASELSNSFLFMLLVQGLFSGLTIGKLAEGNIKAGIKHSFALMMLSFFVSTGANLLFG